DFFPFRIWSALSVTSACEMPRRRRGGSSSTASSGAGWANKALAAATRAVFGAVGSIAISSRTALASTFRFFVVAISFHLSRLLKVFNGARAYGANEPLAVTAPRVARDDSPPSSPRSRVMPDRFQSHGHRGSLAASHARRCLQGRGVRRNAGKSPW